MTSVLCRRLPILWCVPWCLLLAACGGDRVKVYPVRGGVFFRDRPAPGATVVFHPVASTDPKAPRPSGVVAADGTFTLSTFALDDGAPAGDYVVAIVWLTPAPATATASAERGNRLPQVYADPKSSPLRATVKEGPNVLDPFKLKS